MAFMVECMFTINVFMPAVRRVIVLQLGQLKLGLKYKIFHFILFRIIAVPTNAFDSKTKFLEKTRNAFGGGTFSLNEACTNDIQAFYSFLKDSYHKEQPKAYYAVNVIGRQPSSHWCLSREVSGQNKCLIHIYFRSSLINFSQHRHFFS